MLLPPTVEAIRDAILGPVSMRARYHGRERHFSPLLLGRTRTGTWVVVAYQFGGSTGLGADLSLGPQFRIFVADELDDLVAAPELPWREPDPWPERDPKGLVAVLARVRRGRPALS
jgi:hypothetical protein